MEENKANVVENTSMVKSQYCQESKQRKRISKSVNTKYEIYEHRTNPIKRSQSVAKCSTVGSKVVKNKTITPKPATKLDPNNDQDQREIEARLARIEKFGAVTRDLPNSGWTTYYGKPAFEAYGRGSSCSQLISYNVMPHKGANNPKTIQSHYAALIKAKKIKQVNHVPRNPVEVKQGGPIEEKKEVVHLPMESPDLINHPRFTSLDPTVKKDTKIPSNKYTPVNTDRRKSKKAQKRQKKRKPVKQSVSFDGLKYMNVRENLLEQLQVKKNDKEKLAWKVTQCYPYQLDNPQQLKESTLAWESKPVAGMASRVCDKVSELLHPVPD